MSDWQVGDLVVCVDDSPCRCCGDPIPSKAGETYRVSGFRSFPNLTTGAVMFYLAGMPRGMPGHVADGYHSVRFRKITPDKHEACEEEFITLLKRSKVSA